MNWKDALEQLKNGATLITNFGWVYKMMDYKIHVYNVRCAKDSNDTVEWYAMNTIANYSIYNELPTPLFTGLTIGGAIDALMENPDCVIAFEEQVKRSGRLKGECFRIKGGTLYFVNSLVPLSFNILDKTTRFALYKYTDYIECVRKNEQ